MKLADQFDDYDLDQEDYECELDPLNDYICSIEDIIVDEYKGVTESFLSRYYHYLD